MSSRRSFGALIALFFVSDPLLANPPEPSCSGLNTMIRHLDLGPDHVHIRVRQGSDFLNSAMPGWQCDADPPEVERNGSIFLSGLECWYKVTNGSDEDNYLTAGQTFIEYLKIINRCFGDDIVNESPSMIRRNGVQFEKMVILLAKGAQNRKVRVDFSYGRGRIGGPFFWSIETRYTSLPAN